MDAEAMVNEAAVQIAGLAKRNIVLAGQLATALKEIAQLKQALEKKNGPRK